MDAFTAASQHLAVMTGVPVDEAQASIQRAIDDGAEPPHWVSGPEPELEFAYMYAPSIPVKMCRARFVLA